MMKISFEVGNVVMLAGHDDIPLTVIQVSENGETAQVTWFADGLLMQTATLPIKALRPVPT